MSKPSPAKKRKCMVADATYLEHAFSATPENYQAAWETLKAQYESGAKPQARLGTIAPSSLRKQEAMDMFSFEGVERIHLDTDRDAPIPAYLSANISRIQYITETGAWRTEAYSRMIIDQILLTAIYEESRWAELARVPPTTPLEHGHPEDPAQLELLHEVPLSTEVIYKGEEKLLSGFADYTMFYDDASAGSLASNLVVVEAKKEGGADLALPQLIAYMGIVHKARKAEKKENSVVFGVTSDGNTFKFCRVTGAGKFGQTIGLEWNQEEDRGKIYTMFRTIIRTAALSSPSTTPIRDPTRRKVVLSSFGTANARDSARLDFGIDEAKFWEVDEDELDEYEIVGRFGR